MPPILLLTRELLAMMVNRFRLPLRVRTASLHSDVFALTDTLNRVQNPSFTPRRLKADRQRGSASRCSQLSPRRLELSSEMIKGNGAH